MGKTKDIKRKADALRLKEKRLHRQAGMLSRGRDMLDQARRLGRAEGVVVGLNAARNLSDQTPAKSHKGLLHEKLTEAMKQAEEEGAHYVGG